jgi:hypothetical protein
MGDPVDHHGERNRVYDGGVRKEWGMIAGK